MHGYSAHAEIDPWARSRTHGSIGLLRARGDRPILWCGIHRRATATPRTRRSTRPFCRDRNDVRGYSAHAEIDPATRTHATLQGRLLRARGDRPGNRHREDGPAVATPRTRRSTSMETRLDVVLSGCSAHADIDLSADWPSASRAGLLRAGGDRPAIASRSRADLLAPPCPPRRAWPPRTRERRTINPVNQTRWHLLSLCVGTLACVDSR